MAIKLFGFEIVKSQQQFETVQAPITTPTTDDGAITMVTGGYFGDYLNLESNYTNENDLITRYREMAMQPELESAIDDICNESIVHDIKGKTVSIILEDLEQPDQIKDMIRNEFENIMRLLDFSNSGYDIFRRWYIDGRLYYQLLIDEQQPRAGIQELVYIDPRKIKKIRTVEKQKDPRTGTEVISSIQEFYSFNDKIMSGAGTLTSPTDISVRIAPDAVVNINSGIMDPKRQTVLSQLHKAIKPLNQLRMLEDATVIYRISRAPERLVFYVGTGKLNPNKSEEYLNKMMIKYKNRVVYDVQTGEVRDDRKFMSMMENYWIPRGGEGKDTEIVPLQGGQNLGELSDVKYFQKVLYQALGVPVSRIESQTGFMLGRTQEITRDELKFNKFIERLRSKFSTLFDELMERQLALKGICTVDEWKILKEKIHYDFLKDNNFAELKDAELLQSRLALLNQVSPYIGTYFSPQWVKENVLHLDEETIEKMDFEIQEYQMQQAMMAQEAERMAARETQTDTVDKQFTKQVAK